MIPSKLFVLGQSFNRRTGKVIGQQREELIYTRTNILFKKCKTILDVKEAYEQFWNHLNGNSSDVVFVQSIRKPFPKELTNK